MASYPLYTDFSVDSSAVYVVDQHPGSYVQCTFWCIRSSFMYILYDAEEPFEPSNRERGYSEELLKANEAILKKLSDLEKRRLLRQHADRKRNRFRPGRRN